MSDQPGDCARVQSGDASLALEFLTLLAMIQRMGGRALAAQPDEMDALRAGVAAIRAALDALEAQVDRQPDDA